MRVGKNTLNNEGQRMFPNFRMRKRLYALMPALLPAFLFGPLAAQTITTLAGNGTASFSGDLGPAASAGLNTPKGLAVAPNGTLYIADETNYRVRAVSSQGIISTFAGNGTNTFAGDGGQAASASLSNALAVAIDGSGNVYIADPSNRRIRKVSTTGVITTIAGIGVEGYTGDNGPAVSAEIGQPTAIVFDPSGNLYFTDTSPSAMRVRKISVAGTITTVAGNGVQGYSGDGGSALNAALNFPLGISFDQAGNFYIADTGNYAIRKVTPAGIITTVAGTGAAGFSGDGGTAASAALNLPSDVQFDLSGNMYIADAGNNRVRKVDTTGKISTIAGTNSNGFGGDNGLAVNATLNHPWSLAVDANNAIYIADDLNSRIRVIAGATQTQPQLPPSSAENAASGIPAEPVAPGSYVAVYGSAFSTQQAIPAPAFVTPLPTVLGNTSVMVNGVAAPLNYVSPGQINIQIPFNIPTGTATVQVNRGNLSSVVQLVGIATYSPGIFPGAVFHSNYSYVTAAAPAQPGETLIVYATGLGPIDTAVGSGQAAPSTTLVHTLQNPVVTLGTANAAVAFSGLAPSLVAVYQVNFQVPSNMTAGNYNLTFNSGGVVSNTVVVPVQ